MKYPDSSPAYVVPDDTSAFDALVTSIALQLLASCLTFLPASSASSRPLVQQRTSKQSVTALHAHALYRFVPAAGHQARAPSEGSPWPALYTGPEPETGLAEALSQRRRPARQSGQYIPSLAAAKWFDGAGEAFWRRRRRGSSPSSSNGISKRLACHPSVPGDPCRKHNMVLSRIMLCDRTKQDRDLSTKTPRAITQQTVIAQAAQRVPSMMRLRHTQSNLRGKPTSSPRHPIPDVSSGKVHRAGSDPSVGSRLRYDYDDPEVRRVPATSNANHKANSSWSKRGFDRGGMVISQDEVSDNQVRGRPSISAAKISSYIFASTEDPSPLSAPRLEEDDDFFRMASPSPLQGNDHHEQTTDDVRPQFSVVAYDEPRAASARKPPSPDRINHCGNLYFDQNGQTAADRYNDVMYGTETGHNSQERTMATYSISDGRVRRNVSKWRTSSDDWSSDDAGDSTSAPNLGRRARRTKSILYPAGEFDPELKKRFTLSGGEGVKEEQRAAGETECFQFYARELQS